MNFERSRRMYKLTLLAAAVATIEACGGGGGGGASDAPGASPAPSVISGVVLVGALAQPVPPLPPTPEPPPAPIPPSPAPPPVPTPPPPSPPLAPTARALALPATIYPVVVCLDTNRNAACDLGEPSTSADAQGEFTLRDLPASQPAGTPVIAIVPDAAGAGAYVLKAPAAKASVISAITTLVQAGIAQGLSMAAAEAAAARQLQVDVTTLYVNYLGLPASVDSPLPSIARAIEMSLRSATPLRVGGAVTNADRVMLTQLVYTSVTDYSARFNVRADAPDPLAGVSTFFLVTRGLVNGAPLNASIASPQVWYATSTGWVRSVAEAFENRVTSGNPAVTLWGNGVRNTSVIQEIDVSGQSFASVISQLRVPTISIRGASAPTGTMPAGAKIQNISFVIDYPYTYNTADAVNVAYRSSLASLVSAYPTPTAISATSTLQLADFGPVRCASEGLCSQANLRVSFGGLSGSTSYYLCSRNMSTREISNCTASGVGTYAVTTAPDRVTPMMVFTGLPVTTTATNGPVDSRVLIERYGAVYAGSRPGSLASLGGRLNKVAYDAFAAALGIPAAPTLQTKSPYQGLWNATYTGAADSGNCPLMLVDALGALSGTCTSSAATTVAIRVSGSVTDLGATTFMASQTGSSFSGAFTATTASGLWSQGGASGTWSAVKQ